MSDPLPAAPFDAAFAGCPYPVLAAFRSRCPVAEVRTPAGRSVWMLTGSEQVRAAFLDPRLVVTGSVGARPEGSAWQPRRAIDVTLMNQDPEFHARVRRLAAPALTPRRVEAFRPRVEAAATEVLDVLDGLERDGGDVDLMTAFARPFPFAALCALFGVPADERGELLDWLSVLFNRTGRDPDTVERGADALDAYVRQLVRRRAAGPGDDLVSAVVAAWIAGGNATEDEVVSLTAMLMLAGFDSTVQMIGMAVVGLLAQPEVLRLVREDAAAVPRVVEELLRWDTPGPFATPRIATADMLVGDVLIPAGSTVLLGIAAVNHDPERFAEPEVIRVDRRSGGRGGGGGGVGAGAGAGAGAVGDARAGAGAAAADGNGSQHLSFGLGEHFCLGAALARLELEVALRGLFSRFPDLALAVPAAGLAWRGNHTYRRLTALPVRLGVAAP